MAEFDTTEFLAEVRQRGALANADTRFTDALLLASATREMREGICPLLWDAGAEWNVYESTQSVAAATTSVRLPARAAGGKLRNVVWVEGGDIEGSRLDAAGGEKTLMEVGPEDERCRNVGTGTPSLYYLRNASVVLVPAPAAAGALSTPFYARPNALCAADTATVGVVSAVLDDAVTLTTTKPTSMVAGVRVDIVRATPGFETLLASDVLVAASGSGLTLTEVDTSDVVAGDYVCLAGQAPVLQLPVELHGLLATRTARRAMEDLGELEMARRLDDRVAEASEAGRRWLSPRVDGAPKQAGDAWGGILWGHG